VTRLIGAARSGLPSGLWATGARPRRAALTGPRALAPAELRTARMAAQGMSNRDIAQALFLSLKTVEMHLAHTYQKLDIHSRSELPGALATLPQQSSTS
jgi:DNA-binding CsgD family transcriptional regulator